MKSSCYSIIILLIYIGILGSCVKPAWGQNSLSDAEKRVLIDQKGRNITEKHIEPEILQFKGQFYGLVESGYENKLVTMNNKNEFCYFDLTVPEHPQLKVITPGFPGVNGSLGSDAENRVVWLVRGRGVYMVDLDSGKTGHMIAGNYGRVIQVLMTEKERLLFLAVTYSGAEAVLLYVYELANSIDHGEIGVLRLGTHNTLGHDIIIWEQSVPTNPKLTGWFMSDTMFIEMKKKDENVTIYPGGDSLTKELMKNNVHSVNELGDKLLHQKKRLLYAWSYVSRSGPIQPVLVHWSENLQEIEIKALLLQQKDSDAYFNEGPYHLSGDGNWMKGYKIQRKTNPSMYELTVWHLQDHYPQGMSMGISLGYTNKDPGAFMNHSKLGPCYVEKSTSRDGILFLFKLNDGLQILK